MTVQIIRGNALALPLADESVDLVCTSPPYFGLRSYQDGGQHYDGQLGSEATPAEFVAALLAATREMVRVTKPSGSIWVNLGDKYAQNIERMRQNLQGVPPPFYGGGRKDNGGIPTKSLMGVPWRYAIACIDQLGLILRAEIIWNKPNGLPESVTDRVRRSHEQWFHLVKQPRYYSAVDEIREPQLFTGGEGSPNQRRISGNGIRHREYTSNKADYNPLGKLPGSVWTIPTEPLTVPPHLGVDHFAAYPTEWPRRIIQGWTPPGICLECGEGRRPVTVADLGVKERLTPAYIGDAKVSRHGMGATTLGSRGPSATITGYACGCTPYTDHPDVIHDGWMEKGWREYHFDRWVPAPTRPALVVDPFGGTGTTALVADVLGRHTIHIDLSSDYNRLARWRINNPDQRAKAARVDKPPPVIDGQLDLLAMGDL